VEFARSSSSRSTRPGPEIVTRKGKPDPVIIAEESALNKGMVEKSREFAEQGKLSESRQVIVFTHRLSLVGYLEKYAKNQKTSVEIICLSRYTPGELTDLPINLKRTDKAANTLANERLAAAKKAFAQGDEAYEKEATGLCHDIRVLLERVVEMDLLNEVVRRFSQEVNTKDKIHVLAKITDADCKFVDEYMTKYSRYEHSQSDETPIPLPPPQEIEDDLKAIVDFIAALRQRKES
jgi:hypothetical protein